MNRLELAERLVERSRKLGADEAEACVMESASVEIEILDSRAETVNYKNQGGFGIRALKGGRMGFASSNNLDLSTADDIIKKLIDNTLRHSVDEHNVLPDPVPEASDDRSLEQYDEKLKTIPVKKKIEKSIAVDKAARDADPRIVQIGWLQYGDSVNEYAIVSSKGIIYESCRSEVFGYIIAVAMETTPGGQPDQASAQTGTGIEVKSHFGDFDPEIPGKKAARAALRMLGATDGKTGEVEAVFPPESGYSFIDLIADMVSADLVQKKKSIFTGRLGESVASEKTTIIDDGRLKGGLASAALDGEGVPTGAKEIIAGGRLTQLLYDSYTAHKGGAKPTGNAERSSYSSRPMIAPTNFYLRPGNTSRNKLIGSVGNGLYITEVSGLHASVDPITGDFSIPCKGLMIEYGELSRPISNITISGNMFDFLRRIDGIANDLTWEVRGNIIGVPTYRVSGIKISGR